MSDQAQDPLFRLCDPGELLAYAANALEEGANRIRRKDGHAGADDFSSAVSRLQNALCAIRGAQNAAVGHIEAALGKLDFYHHKLLAEASRDE